MMTTPEEFDQRARDAALQEVAALDGCLVIGVDAEKDDFTGDYFPVFIVVNQHQERYRVLVSRDGEGNGPGVLFFEDANHTPANNG